MKRCYREGSACDKAGNPELDWCPDCVWCLSEDAWFVIKSLRAERDAAYDAALEKAAQIADAYAKKMIDEAFAEEEKRGFWAMDRVETPDEAVGAENIAAAIRALKGKK